MPSKIDNGNTGLLPSADESDGVPAVRLLVIEDESLHSTLISRAGRMAGFIPTVARSLGEASALLRESKFDCITLDLSLGGLRNGTEIFRVLAEVNCKAPIVIISGATARQLELTSSMARSHNLNMAEPVAKTLDFARLRKALAEVKRKLDQQPAARRLV
jgi:DNA-binding response OmpR family regulator